MTCATLKTVWVDSPEWLPWHNTVMRKCVWVADAGIIVPWTVWKQFGDTQIIEESWNAMDLFMNHINDTKYNHETLCGENGNYQWDRLVELRTTGKL